MTEYSVREIADICEKSKTTIQRIINEEGIEYKVVKNKHLYDYESAELICRKVSRKAVENLTKTKPPQTAENQQENEKNQTISKQIENRETKRNQTDKSTDELIIFLKAEIEQKNQQINSLIEENKMLITTNAVLVKQLEEPKKMELIEAEILDNEIIQTEAEQQENKKWWKFW